MKQLLPSSICVATVLASLSSPLLADQKDELIERLMQRLDKVEAELSEIKQANAELSASTEEQFDELNERADENEFESTMSKVKFGFDMETSVNFLNGQYTNSLGRRVEVDSKEKWTSVFHLNMDAAINDRTTFTGRLGVAKNWGDYTNGFTADYNQGRKSMGGNSVFLERAYIDYKITDKLIATIGRQPGSDGPGSNLRNNSSRQATYPAIIFSANGDGVVLTYKPEIDGLSNTAIRAFYAKMYQWDTGAESSLLGREAIDDARIFGAMFETELPLGDMGENLMILWALQANKVTMPSVGGNIPIGGGMTLPFNTGELNVGDLRYANLYFENNHTFGTKLSYFMSLAYMKGSNAVDNTQLIASRNNPLLAPAVPGFVAATRLNEENAHAVQAGLRYDLTPSWKLGYQYFHGSRYWYSFQTAAASDPLGLTQTRGDAHELYGIYQIDMNQFLRIGYSRVNYDYTGSGAPVGPAVRAGNDDEVENISLTYNVRF